MPEDTITPEAVIDLLEEQQIIEAQEPLTASTDLFAHGLDSMAMMQLLLHIEDRFGVEVTAADMTREHFQSAAAMAAFLSAKAGRR